MLSDEADAAAWFGADAFSKPDGTKRMPARTCRQLFESRPDLPDGDYWIDPNGGQLDDSVRVACSRAGKLTCLQPKRAGTVKRQWITKASENYTWVSEESEEFVYSMEGSQLAYLQLLSNQASQKVTLSCSRMPVIAGAASPALFYTDSGRILNGGERDNRLFGYSVQQDDCQYGKNSWADTVVSFEARAVHLPVRDVALVTTKEFGLRLHQVCFS